MPSYELTLIMRNMAHPELVQAIKKASCEIYKSGGYIRQIQSLGFRTLPNLKVSKGRKHREGTYMLMDIDVKASDLVKINDEFIRDRNIIQQNFLSKKDEFFVCPETLDDEMKPPAERPSVQRLIEQGRRPPRFKKIFDSKTGLDYYPFHR